MTFHSRRSMGCMRELAALRAACAQGEFVSERSLSRLNT